jgi:nicotinamidase-related amidase
MARALLIIDIQNDYFPGGRFPLVGPVGAARSAARVLDRFRGSGEPVIHVQHVWDAEDAAFFQPGTPGIEIHELVAPAEGEPVVRKELPNAFLGTDLEARLRADGIDSLVVAGMMSSMCVDATVRAASDLGFGVTVVHDACAAPDLEFGGQSIDGRTVHATFMAALDGNYAALVTADEAIA